MSVDNDQILPDERTRHWMLAQTHLAFEERDNDGDLAEEPLLDEADESFLAKPLPKPTDLDRARAKKAFDVIRQKVDQRDLNSDHLAEDLLSEKAYELKRFATKDAGTLMDELIKDA